MVQVLFTEGLATYANLNQITLRSQGGFMAWRSNGWGTSSGFVAGRPLPLGGTGVAIFTGSNGGTMTGNITANRTSIYSRRAVNIIANRNATVAFNDGGSSQITALADTSTGSVFVWRGGTSGTLLFSSNQNIVPIGAWLSFGVAALIDPSAGWVKVWINNTLVCNISGVNTQATSNTQMNAIIEGSAGGGLWTDFYLADTGDLGDQQIYTLFPTADGATDQFTPQPNTNQNYQNVNSELQTTNYNFSSTVGNIDRFAMGACPAGVTISAVTVKYAAWKDSSGARSAEGLIVSGSSTDTGTANDLSSSVVVYSDVYNTDPATSAAWTVSGLNAAQPGYKVAA